MNCERVRQLLSREHDGCPAGREAGAVAAHLTECPGCLRFRSGLPAIRGRLRELEEWQPGAARELTPRALARWRTLQSVPAPARAPWLCFLMPLPAIRRPLRGALALALLALLLSRAGWQRRREDRVPAPRIALRGSPAHPVLPPIQAQRLVVPPSLRQSRKQAPHREEAPVTNGPSSPPRVAREDQRPAVDDLTLLNAGPEGEIHQWVSVPHDEWQRIEQAYREIQRRDGAVQVRVALGNPLVGPLRQLVIAQQHVNLPGKLTLKSCQEIEGLVRFVSSGWIFERTVD